MWKRTTQRWLPPGAEARPPQPRLRGSRGTSRASPARVRRHAGGTTMESMAIDLLVEPGTACEHSRARALGESRRRLSSPRVRVQPAKRCPGLACRGCRIADRVQGLVWQVAIRERSHTRHTRALADGGHSRPRGDSPRDAGARGLPLLANAREPAAVHDTSRARHRPRRRTLALGRQGPAGV